MTSPRTQKRKRFRKLGVCTECGDERSDSSLMCERHRAMHVAKTKRWKDKKKRECNCISCGQAAVQGQVLCAECRMRRLDGVREKRRRYREAGICTQCGTPLSSDDIAAGHTSHFWKDCKPYRSNI